MVDVQLSDLNSASVANNADYTLLRQGLTDYKCAVGLIRNIPINNLPSYPTPGYASPADLFMIASAANSFGNYQIQFSQVGLVYGTILWFGNANVPIGWNTVPNSGDRLIAVAGPTATYATYNPGTIMPKSFWQQEGVGGGVPGGGLSITQIPNHQHYGQFGLSQSNKNATYIYGCYGTPSGTDPKYSTQTVVGIVGGYQDNATHSNYGACAPHNHGNTWRPCANVGLLGIKVT